MQDLLDQWAQGPTNIEPYERYLSMAAGLLVLWIALKRLPIIFLTLITGGGYLLYRGVTGRCHIYEALGVDSEAVLRRAEELGHYVREETERFTPTAQEDDTWRGDEVTEAARESFPSSDPPAWTLGQSDN